MSGRKKFTDYEYEGRRSGYRKKKRRGKKIRNLFVILFAVVLVFQIKNIVSEGTVPQLAFLTDGKARQVMENADQYPADLVEIVKNNPETAEFVLDYPEKKDQAPADTVGELTGGIPLLLQWDERWGYTIYGDNYLAVNGCGPTAVAMVAAGLTGDNTITPCKVARYAAEQGYYTGESGTSWDLMTSGVQRFGIYGEEMGLSESEVMAALESGCPIICSMRPGDFTTTGHFIVLTGVENGKIRVNDPNSRIRSERLWDYDTLEWQISNLWVYSLLY